MLDSYPVGVELAAGRPVARWRPLVNWLLALPVLGWLILVVYGAQAVAGVAWLAIVFTGRMPDRLGNYLMAVLRYQWRVCSFLFGLTDRYPGFRLVAGYVDPADHPSVFYSAQSVDRRRVTVLFRFVLILPLLLLAYVVGYALVGLLFVGWWTVLVLGRWPVKLRAIVVAGFRWQLRVASYGWLITDNYPPFRVEIDKVTSADPSDLITVGAADPREVTGPPWPRLVAAGGYEPPRVPCWPIVVGAALLALTVVAQASSGAATDRAGSSGSARATTSAPVAWPPDPPAAAQELASRVIAAPPGYTPGAGLLWPNGLGTRAAFDQVSGAGAASEAGFIGGYEATYESNATEGLLDIQLLRLSSAMNADSLLESSAASVAEGEAPRWSALPAIPDAIAVDGTQAVNGIYDHAVLAVKGSTVMQLDFMSWAPGPAPAGLAAWAKEQYLRL